MALSLTGQRFLRYVAVPSAIDPKALNAGYHPSSPGQVQLAQLLLEDFVGFADEVGTDYAVEWYPGGVLVIKIKATPGFEQAP